MSRYTFTPMQLCGKPSCDLIGVSVQQGKCLGPDRWSGPEYQRAGPLGAPAAGWHTGEQPFQGHFLANRGDPVVPQLDAALRRPVRERSLQLVLPHYLQGRAYRVWHLLHQVDRSVTTINATCQVADQTVKLQSIAAARLNGVGTYAAVTPFNLVVAGCPRGYNRVGYSLQAVGARWPKARCAAAPGGQHRDRRIDPGHRRGRRAATDGTLVAGDRVRQEHRRGLLDPDEASYVQTAEKITPGSVLAAMVILLDYQ